MIFLGIVIFLLGAVLGSAANALIDRLPKDKSWISGRSKCDSCGHTLAWQDLIPVWSYLLLSGKCRYCHSPIPRRNLMVELVTGLGFLVIFLTYGFDPTGIFLGLTLWVTTIIAVMDWETKLVSEIMVIFWGALVVIGQLMQPVARGNGIATDSLTGAVIGITIIGGVWLLSRGKAMGAGDVEIAAVMGWWLGWQKLLVALWMAFVTGAIVGLMKVMNKTASMKSELAFGPFLILGTWVAFLLGRRIWSIWGL